MTKEKTKVKTILSSLLKMKKEKTKVKTILLSSLKPNPKNPRSITDENLEKLCKSIKNFNRMLTLRPMIVDENNIVLGGNMRLQALKKLGYKEIPENWVKKTLDLTEEEKRQFLIKDNIEYGDWEEKILKDNYDIFELKEFNIDIDIEMDFGGDDNEEEPKEDECPALKKESIVKMGDLWLLGKHRLRCGDSTIISHIDDLINNEKINLVFCDPPYGINYSGGRTQVVNKKEYGKLKNDNLKGKELANLICNIFNFGQKETYICVSPIKIKPFLDFIYDNKKEVNSVIVWDKGNAGLGYMPYRRQCEFILYVRDKPFTKKDKSDFDLWQINRDNSKDYVHGTQKPVGVPARAIKNSSKKNDIVLDLFGGSGSTLIACEQLNRKCYMMELDEIYCQVILDRYLNFKQNKGKDVFLLKDGKKILYKEIVKKI